MKKLLFLFFIFLSAATFFVSCTDVDDQEREPKLIIKFKFDPNQVRLNNIGAISTIPDGNAAQSPTFNSISSNYIEFSTQDNTALGQGAIIYQGETTNVGGETAIDFSKAKIVSEGEAFLEIPLSQLPAGTYNWTRVSLSYQNYEIVVRHVDEVTGQGDDYTGTLASFVGYNTYIGDFSIGNNMFPINSNKLQGFWAFALNDYAYQAQGQAPDGATTVPNPLFATSPIPQGSCVVTGKFATPLVITGNDKTNVVVTLSLSTNKSFEWQEILHNNKFDAYLGENVVDMGLRGLKPTYTR
jgi:hypothetical protein